MYLSTWEQHFKTLKAFVRDKQRSKLKFCINITNNDCETDQYI